MTIKKIFFLLGVLTLAHLSYGQSDKQAAALNIIMQNYSKAVEKYETTSITARTFTFTFVNKGKGLKILAQHIGRTTQ